MSTEKRQIRITIGIMSDPIYKQLTKQGVKTTSAEVSHFQMAHDGFVQLRVLGCMGDKEADRIAQRLAGKIAKFKPKPPQQTE